MNVHHWLALAHLHQAVQAQEVQSDANYRASPLLIIYNNFELRYYNLNKAKYYYHRYIDALVLTNCMKVRSGDHNLQPSAKIIHYIV